MKLKILIITASLFLFNNFAFAQTDENDVQFWNETTFEFLFSKRNEKLSGIVIGNLRFTEDISDLSDKRVGVAIKYKATKNMTVRPSYLFRVQKSSRPKNRYEHRLIFDLTAKKSFKSFSIENRSRFEHRVKTNRRNDDTFYRNRTKFNIPVTKNDEVIFMPSFSNDTFFDLQNTRIYRNDATIGISRKFTKSFTVDFFYQYRRNLQAGKKRISIIGINLKFKDN